MLSLHRSQPAVSTMPPWFARASEAVVVDARSLSPPASSTTNNSSEVVDNSSEAVVAAASTSFRNRYPARCYKRPRNNNNNNKCCEDDNVIIREDQDYDEMDLPADPRTWMREDVQNWIRRMSVLHGLPSVQSDRFLMNGKALCLMTMEMFCQRVPLGGKMLYKDFQLRLSMAMYNSSISRG